MAEIIYTALIINYIPWLLFEMGLKHNSPDQGAIVQYQLLEKWVSLPDINVISGFDIPD